MSKKKRIKELERRLAVVEAELAQVRGQRTTITWYPPNTHQPMYWWQPGQVTCTNPAASSIPDKIARVAMLSGRN